MKHFGDGAFRISRLQIHAANGVGKQDNLEFLSETVEHGMLDAIVRCQSADKNALDTPLSLKVN